ncbi:voltage-dependent N-type calcium channel subunit alpha-1B isoform X1 [Hydra vulgaris]|uniref:voltage-dependent N-type calcium channel subunit alpha-1B isoform X1 n=2 Tax=Hydra vulgaris TaxID=6087 RepID=UPI001F5F6B63|nr:voltage-dependent N-type calcium channel subunit alpha-1B-like isoform X1 [Hydra vulgaris]
MEERNIQYLMSQSRASSLQKLSGPERKKYSSLFIFSETNPFRRWCRTISDSKVFDYFILATIGVNCVLLALNSPLPKHDKSRLNLKLEKAELYMLIIFITEAILKIVTQGFILHPGSYLRNAWNILDFIVVVTGIISLPEVDIEFDAGSIKALRAGRVLRPLKLVSGIPSLQVVMKSIMRAMAPLLQICLLVGFVIVIYSIIGLEFLNGHFHKYCLGNTTDLNNDKPQLCGKNGFQCEPGTYCNGTFEGPSYGIASFDNMLLSMLTVFTCITCEGWSQIMYDTFDVYDKNGLFFWIYYYSLNIIGAKFMLNLVLGVLSGEFGKERERVENRTTFLLLRQGQQVDRALNGYMDWIDAAEQAINREEDEENHQLKRIRNQKKKEDGINLGMTKILMKGSSEKKFRLNMNNSSPKQTLKELLHKKLRRFRLAVKRFVNHSVFYWSIITCVFLNTVSVAVQHYRQPQWLSDLQDISEQVFLTFFLMEMFLKIYGLGPTMYFRSKFNKFDFVVVTAGVFELIIYKIYKISMGISVLRALRLLRLFKFTRYWSSLKNLITSLLSSIKSIISLIFLLFLFILIFALLGMQLFGGGFSYKIPPLRTNFNDFGSAMLAVFQILTGEDWNTVMHEGILVYGGPKSAKGLSVSLYFVTLVVLGNYTLLNVFLAIAVDNLTNAQEISEDEASEEKARLQHNKEIKQKYAPKIMETESLPVSVNTKEKKVKTNEFDTFPYEGGNALPNQGFMKNLKFPGRMTGLLSYNPEVLQMNSMFICFPGNRVRIFIFELVTSKYFDNAMLVLILVSSAFLSLEDMEDRNSTRNMVLKYFDFFFTSIFSLEILLKIIAYGVVLHPGSYFRDPWNVIDALVVSCAIASLSLEHIKSSSQTQKYINVLRVLRVLRPLKAINKTKKLKAVFHCMLYSLKNVINILLITFQFLFIFAVMGVQLFSGKFYYCTDISKNLEESCQGQYIDFKDNKFNEPKNEKRDWMNSDFNFNNVFEALITLFTSSTGEGWPTVMFTAIDSTGYDKGPLLNNQIQVSLFFVSFVVVFTFFFLNIFVALIILTFQEQGESEEGDCELDRNQRGCLQIAMESKPGERFMPENPNSLQYKLWLFVDSVPFEYFIMLLICGNTFILMLKFHEQPKSYSAFLEVVNIVFTFLFTAEFFLKIFALRQNYFRDGWNVFDFIIVLGSVLDFLFLKLSGPDIPFDPSLFRLFRAARLIKLLRRGYTIRILLWTFLQSFKALPYVAMLIFLLFFIYAIIGMQMFALISLDNGDEAPWSEINQYNHFRAFFPAMQVLFRAATGENWHNIMLACTSKAKCDQKLAAAKGQEYCGSEFAYMYFVSFIFFCSFLMLNLFVAVIMDNFGYLTQDESILGPHHLDEFVRVWAEFDPRATGRIKHTEVCQLLRQMSPPIGLGTKCPKVVAYKRLIRMNMPLHPDNTVDFTATLFALVRTALNIMTDKNNLHSNNIEMRLMLKRVWPNITKKTLDRVIPKRNQGASQMTVGKIYCAKLIYENYKHLRLSSKQNKNNLCAVNNLTEESLDISNIQMNKSLQINDSASTNALYIGNYNTRGNNQLPIKSIQSTQSSDRQNLIKKQKKDVALAIKSGKNPYDLYGLPPSFEEEEWC